MFNQTKLHQVWDAIHQQKSSSPLPEKGLVPFAEYLQQQCLADAPVLDLGCGRGRNTRFLSQAGFTVHGCDWSLFALKEAKSHSRPGKPAFFSVADLTCLPFPDDYFAAVVCVHVLPYLVMAGITWGIHEMRRVLRPGGWLYVDLLDRDDAEYGRGTKLEKHTYLDEDGVPMHFSSQNEVDKLFRDFLILRQSRLELGRRVIWEIWAKK
jgi:ubiquinone/menaquinone biosynthesis C-methylase UbiE